MSINRIKKVSFDSFRAFSGSLELDFEVENNIADIVVIYAQNGTGKTSAIEGIEWATTGKISRIDGIISRNNARNKNPKEGNILKNRQSSKKNATVSIELENGSLIKRKTKPKQNRNNDYCEGIVESNVDYSNKFSGNILSQGAISKFSYEASSGELFKSLVNNKGGHKDIEVYDKLNDIKNRFENDNIKCKNQIAYITEQIDVYTNDLKELEQHFIEDSGFLESEEYCIFKENYSLYKNLSNAAFSEVVSYFTELSTLFDSLKEKLISFDLSEFKRVAKEDLLASKIIHLDGIVLDKSNEIRVLERQYGEVKKNIESINLFLEPSNITTINSSLNLHSRIVKNVDACASYISKLININEKISLFIKLNSASNLVEKQNNIDLAIASISSIFGDCDKSGVKVTSKDSFISKIDSSIESESEKLVSLTRTSYIEENPNDLDVSNLKGKSLELGSLNSNIAELESEREKISTFEEKLGLIKSYALEVINQKQLSSCPACGKKYNSIDDLIESVESLESESQSLVEGAIGTLNKQKTVLVEEIENIKKKIDSAVSTKKISIEKRLSKLKDRKKQITKLYSLLHELNVIYEGVQINEVLKQIYEIKKGIEVKISIKSRKYKKYQHWFTKVESLILSNRQDLDSYNSDLQDLSKRCLTQFGISIEELFYASQSNHVYLYKIDNFKSHLEKVNEKLSTEGLKLKELEDIISKIRVRAGFHQNKSISIHELLKKAKNRKKEIRTNYNYIKSMLYSYSINNNLHVIEQVTLLKDRFDLYLSNLEKSKEIILTKKNLAESELSLLKKKSELNAGIASLRKVNKALDDSMDYFSQLASESINSEILNDMFMYIEPHLKYDEISFKVDLHGSNKGIYIQARDSSINDNNTPIYYLSEAQINILSICIFLAEHARKLDDNSINAIVIDDPVQSMDDLNSYALIDLCKIFARRFRKQIIITTHNRSFFNLFREKLPEMRYSTKYISL
ncbi:TPA: hypothetical protein RQL04_002890 [Vibrio vulnificus]|nr:hypothetical protein [Vibrio vulnificus]